MEEVRKNITSWERFQSYVADVVLQKVSSAYSDELELILRNNRLILQTPRVFYSHEDRYGSFLTAFSKQVPTASENALVLGFGMGSIPIILEKQFSLKPDICGLEIDQAIITLAESYLSPYLMERIELLKMDARKMQKLAPRQFEMICVDVFIEDQVPEDLGTVAYLESLRDRLAPGGQLYFSRMDREAGFAKNFESVFADGFPLEAEANQVWYWEKA